MKGIPMKKLVTMLLVLIFSCTLFGAMYARELDGEKDFKIYNDSSGVLTWKSSGEDLKWTVSSNAITLSSSTGVTAFNFGSVIPQFGGYPSMVSTLATNAPDAANSIWGISGGIVAEGTANAYETFLMFKDPLADANIYLPATDTAGDYYLMYSAINDPNKVTSSVAELNILDGVTATYAELNLLDGSVKGEAKAGLAMIFGDNNDVNVMKVNNALFVSGAKITKSSTAINQQVLPDANGYFSLSKIYSLSSGTIPASSCWGGTYVSTSATDVDACLPSPTAGMDITFMLMAGTDVNITAAANGNILYVTKRNIGPNSISSDEIAGSYIHLRAVDDANWMIMDVNGTWSGIN